MIKNVDFKVEGSKAIITVDLTKEFGPSSTGKTIIVATTGGSQQLKEKISFGLNVFKKP